MHGKARQSVQRVASLLQLPPLLAEFGIPLADVLEGTGVGVDQLRPEVFVAYSAYLAILDNAARLTGRADIALLLGQRQTLAVLGPLGQAMRHAATLGEALADFTAFQILNSTGGAVYLMRADRDVLLGYGVYDAEAPVSPLIYDLVMAVGCNLIAELTGGAVAPEEILFSRAAPGDLAPYQRLARCPLRFDQIQTGVLLPESALEQPLPAADAGLHEAALAALIAALTGAPRGLTGQVRHVLRPLLLMGQGSMPHVAARLGLHPRSLRRHLVKEGTTFAAIKDEVRRVTAQELLRLGPLGITDIALTLDYASASSFIHAFRRWTGQTPADWRAYPSSRIPS